MAVSDEIGRLAEFDSRWKWHVSRNRKVREGSPSGKTRDRPGRVCGGVLDRGYDRAQRRSHMRVLAAISSPAQDDVIEPILRSRGEWHPPWERQHLPPGPPKQLELFEDSGVHLWDPEDENQDPPGDW